jgi:hypothetical protein
LSFAALPLGGGVLGWSPITDFNGQTLNAGHFWHPATMAIGHSVMICFLKRCTAIAAG